MNDASTPLPSAHDLVEIAREASATRLAALNGPQGYDLKLFPFAPSHEFRCWVCKQVARQAVVINGDPCASVFCNMCLRLHLDRVGLECPRDKRPLRAQDVFPLDFINRKIYKLKVKCHIAPSLCHVIGDIGVEEEFWREHESKCEYVILHCKWCDKALLRRDHARHEQQLCEDRQVPCTECNEMIPFKTIDVHLRTCPAYEVNRLRADLTSLQAVVVELKAELDRRTITQQQVNVQHEQYAQKILEALRLAEAERKADTDRLDESIVREVDARQAQDAQLLENIKVNDRVQRALALDVLIEARKFDSFLIASIDTKADARRVDHNFRVEVRAREQAVEKLEKSISEASGDTQINFERVHALIVETDIKHQIEEKRLQTEITITNANIAQEIIDRKIADEEVTALIRAEAAARVEADEFLARALHAQNQERVEEIAVLRSEQRVADNMLLAEIDMKADSVHVDTAIKLEEQHRKHAEQKLKQLIEVEVEERARADEATRVLIHEAREEHRREERRLQVEITKVDTKVDSEIQQRRIQDDRIEEDLRQLEMRRKADVERIDDTLKLVQFALAETDREAESISAQIEEVRVEVKEFQGELLKLAEAPRQAELQFKASIARVAESLRQTEFARKSDSERVFEWLNKSEKEVQAFMKRTDEDLASTKADLEMTTSLLRTDVNRTAAQLNVAEIERAKMNEQTLASLRQYESDRRLDRDQINAMVAKNEVDRKADTNRVAHALSHFERERVTDAQRLAEALNLSEVNIRKMEIRTDDAIAKSESRYAEIVKPALVDSAAAVDKVQHIHFELQQQSAKMDETMRALEKQRAADLIDSQEKLAKTVLDRRQESERLEQSIAAIVTAYKQADIELSIEISKVLDATRAVDVERKNDVMHAADALQKHATEVKNEILPVIRHEMKQTNEMLLQEEEERRADVARTTASLRRAELDLQALKARCEPFLQKLDLEQRSAAMRVAEMEAAEQKRAEDAVRAQFTHPGQLKKHVNKVYWSCCQTPATGNKDAFGCQSIANIDTGSTVPSRPSSTHSLAQS